ncbi:hypothetical protein DP73_13340 [Desulfosporosinus sp. HMP52]|uniref:hypothetical protein n=1 Tax=Desulfosporosinus sp. HMP52 TaxID=1487923 RepID=UPI00051FACCE|nr:hypothetical protein [Desulfosporosinus sp. HMP52]KGK88272.1 hypothetical protein DP73_13340 [Desulfosporosinus sp. HMP52]
MKDLADYQRSGNKKKKYVRDFPEGILDVIEKDYPERYSMIVEGLTSIAVLFSAEEWIEILTKSRNSFRSHMQRTNLTKIYPLQGNKARFG